MFFFLFFGFPSQRVNKVAHDNRVELRAEHLAHVAQVVVGKGRDLALGEHRAVAPRTPGYLLHLRAAEVVHLAPDEL